MVSSPCVESNQIDDAVALSILISARNWYTLAHTKRDIVKDLNYLIRANEDSEEIILLLQYNGKILLIKVEVTANPWLTKERLWVGGEFARSLYSCSCKEMAFAKWPGEKFRGLFVTYNIATGGGSFVGDRSTLWRVNGRPHSIMCVHWVLRSQTRRRRIG